MLERNVCLRMRVITCNAHKQRALLRVCVCHTHIIMHIIDAIRCISLMTRAHTIMYVWHTMCMYGIQWHTCIIMTHVSTCIPLNTLSVYGRI